MSPNARLAVALAAGVTSVFGLWLLLSGGSLSSKTDVDERQRSSAPPAEVEPAREETRHAADAIGEPLREQEQDHDQEQPQEETDAVSDTVEPIPGKWLITGRIVRQAASATSDGFEPVEGARVHLRTHPRRTRPGGALPPRSRITGADGHFAFGGIPGNLWILVEVDVPPFAYRTLSSELDEPEGAGELRLGEILLEPARTLRIDVVRAAGEPVENADVLVGRPRTQRPETLSNTGFHESRRQAKELGKGSYLLERAPRGLLRIQVLAPGYARFREYVDVGEEEVAFIRLAEGLKIAGLVRTDDGRPVPGASLEVDGPNVGDPPPTTRTDASGRFVFDVLSEGEYSIEVKAEGFVSLRQESIT
ncbi:MAG: carboxypeptidase-like regulatory domain-containing protein, partial [Planctomycetota bacterium]|nr:carboxypeptidase-like regulatory domain-containing protein [Planctomycetota bacterium]